MKELKDSGIPWVGEIPKHWSIIRNKNLYSCGKEIVGNKSNDIQLLSLTTKGIIKKGQEVAGGKVPESYDTYQIVEKNNIVLCLFDLDCSAVFSGVSNYDGMISPAYRVLSCNKGVSPKYTGYWFSFIFNGRKYKHYSKNLRYTLSFDEFGVLTSILPPFSEQQRIADFLDQKCADIDNIIEKTNLSIEEYKKLKQSVITEAVTKGVRGKRQMKDSGIECLGLVPTEWKTIRLRHWGECQNGISKSADFFGEGSPFVSYSDVYKNSSLPREVEGRIMSTPEEQETFSVREGDVFFTRTSETIEEIGFSSVCLANIPNATFAGFVIRVRPYDNTLIPGFSKYYFRSLIPRKYFIKEMNLVTRASLGQSLLKGLPILVPSKEEQTEISQYLDSKCFEIDSLIESKEKFIKGLESYKKSLIYEYVTGKKELRV